ncbi:MAG: PLP-dependent aminotransferase family protein [Planctomyces sp.]|nr:PLP-dependent aminotransferase family protein [Planctomyces sp.]
MLRETSNSAPVSSVPALHFSQHSRRAADQAISYLMQQGVENPDCISLAAGLVDEKTLPVQLTKAAVDRVLRDPESGRTALQYGTTPGPEHLRRTFRSWLAELEGHSNGLNNLPLDQIVLTTGSQQLLLLITQALFNPGDLCLVAAPTYFVFLGVLEAAGAKAIPVKSDENGMCPVDLERQLKAIESRGELDRVKLVYTVSYYDNPSGVSISEDRRPRLLDLVKTWSRNHRILLLEDAAYRELHYDGPKYPSIWSFDTDREFVILASTFSKSFSPGVRVGMGVLPKELVKPVCDLKGNEDFGSAHLNQNVVAEVIRSGDYRRHVDSVQTGYRVKRDAMVTAARDFFSDIPGVTWVEPNGGMYVWMTLPAGVETGFNSPLFRYAAQKEKVMYVPGELCYPSDWHDRPRSQMRLSFGVQQADGVREGMLRLSRAVRHILG